MRTAGLGTVIIRDSREEARRVFEAMFARNGNGRPWEDQPVGTPEDVWLAVKFIIECDFFTGRVVDVDGGSSL